MVVRALRRSDADEWQAVRARNHDWLRPWDATVPPGAAPRPSSYKVVTRSLLHQAKLGQCLPFVIEVEGRFAHRMPAKASAPVAAPAIPKPASNPVDDSEPKLTLAS